MSRRFQFSLRALLAAALFVAVDAAVLQIVFPGPKDGPFFVGLVGGPAVALTAYIWMTKRK